MKLSTLAASLLMGATFLTTASDAWALKESRPIATDSRIRTVVYNENDIFKFTGHYGVQSSIEFAPDETVETISIGDSIAWQIVPSANRLFLKPVEEDATTNMTVITDQRTYHFELHAEVSEDINSDDMIFVMRFIYIEGDDASGLQILPRDIPLPDLTDPVQLREYNFDYSLVGPDNTAPIRIFDDGEFTYFEFRDKNADVPAFFIADEDGDETLVNYRKRGPYIIVERVAARYTLRHGKEVVCVYNNELYTPAQQQ